MSETTMSFIGIGVGSVVFIITYVFFSKMAERNRIYRPILTIGLSAILMLLASAAMFLLAGMVVASFIVTGLFGGIYAGFTYAVISSRCWKKNHGRKGGTGDSIKF